MRIRSDVTEEEARQLMQHLTPTQRDVLAAYCRTGFYKLAAAELGMAQATAENHMEKARQRLEAAHTVQLIIVATKAKLV